MWLGKGGATSAQRLSDGGASAKVVNLGIVYIQIYIQICSICTRGRTKHGHQKQGAIGGCPRGAVQLSIGVR